MSGLLRPLSAGAARHTSAVDDTAGANADDVELGKAEPSSEMSRFLDENKTQLYTKFADYIQKNKALYTDLPRDELIRREIQGGSTDRLGKENIKYLDIDIKKEKDDSNCFPQDIYILTVRDGRVLRLTQEEMQVMRDFISQEFSKICITIETPAPHCPTLAQSERLFYVNKPDAKLKLSIDTVSGEVNFFSEMYHFTNFRLSSSEHDSPSDIQGLTYVGQARNGIPHGEGEICFNVSNDHRLKCVFVNGHPVLYNVTYTKKNPETMNKSIFTGKMIRRDDRLLPDCGITLSGPLTNNQKHGEWVQTESPGKNTVRYQYSNGILNQASVVIESTRSDGTKTVYTGQVDTKNENHPVPHGHGVLEVFDKDVTTARETYSGNFINGEYQSNAAAAATSGS